MDLGSLIAAVILSFGLIGTDAIINAGNISFNIQVTESLSKDGYTPQIVDAMMDSYLREYIEFQSILHPPQIRAAQQESVVSAVAASLNLKDVTQAIQADFGLNPVRLTGSLMPAATDSKQLRFLLTGTSTHTGIFVIDQNSGTTPLPQFIEHVASLVVAEVEPYAAAVHQFNMMADNLVAKRPNPGHQELIDFIKERVSSEAGQSDSDVDHAAFHNLLGITAMMFGDANESEKELRIAQTLDPQMGIPLLNLAVEYISQQRFDEAIELANQSMAARTVRITPFLMANAHTIRALAFWGKGDKQKASAEFLNTVNLYPNTLWGYFYWAELLDSVGNTRDAAVLWARAQYNMGRFETYPEVSFLHLQVLPDKNFALKPVNLQRMRHISELSE